MQNLNYAPYQESSQYFRAGSAQAAHFEWQLGQLVAVGQPPARTIKCLEAAKATCADVYLFWLAMGAATDDVLADDTFKIPREVGEQIKALFNDRYSEIFEEDGRPAHMASFYLNPGKSCSKNTTRQMLTYHTRSIQG